MIPGHRVGVVQMDLHFVSGRIDALRNVFEIDRQSALILASDLENKLVV